MSLGVLPALLYCAGWIRLLPNAWCNSGLVLVRLASVRAVRLVYEK